MRTQGVTKTGIILNAAAGAGERRRIKELLHALRPNDVLMEANDGAAVPPLVRQAVRDGCTLIVAGGGDGTIRAVAQELVGGRAMLGVLPLGTRNHFARALGIPLDLRKSVQLLGNGQARQIDVGEINGIVFLLYAALGLYPLFVKERERHESVRRHTSLAFLRALMGMIRRYGSLHVRLQTDTGMFDANTPFVFVTNNIATAEYLPLGVITCPDIGQLGVYTAHRVRSMALFCLSLRVLFGRLTEDQNLQALSSRAVFIETARNRLWVAADGEIMRLHSPLNARIRQNALCVLVPPATAVGGAG